MQEMWEMWVQSLSWEDPLQERMATHSSILPRTVSGTEEPGRLHSPWGRQELDRIENECKKHIRTSRSRDPL